VGVGVGFDLGELGAFYCGDGVGGLGEEWLGLF
jgi:hypothetical protein